jgi:hypothetical protein
MDCLARFFPIRRRRDPAHNPRPYSRQRPSVSPRPSVGGHYSCFLRRRAALLPQTARIRSGPKLAARDASEGGDRVDRQDAETWFCWNWRATTARAAISPGVKEAARAGGRAPLAACRRRRSRLACLSGDRGGLLAGQARPLAAVWGEGRAAKPRPAAKAALRPAMASLMAAAPFTLLWTVAMRDR